MRLELIPRYAVQMLRKLSLIAAAQLVGTITHVRTKEPLVALTFDDGPHPEYTPRLLEILNNHRARGTFFVIGEAARQHPEILRRAAQDGHAIANHSWDHPSFPLISGRERRAQIRACAKAIAPFGERLFRPPYCDQNIASRLDAFWLGYRVVAYSVATDDWCGGDALSIARQIETRVQSGSVIVLHERLFNALEGAYFNRESLLQAVEITLARLRDRFEFITLPELLRRGSPQKEFWNKRTDVKLLNRLLTPAGPSRRYSDAAARNL